MFSSLYDLYKTLFILLRKEGGEKRKKDIREELGFKNQAWKK